LLSFALRVPPRAEWWLALLAGVLTRFLSTVTGVFVIPLVPDLNALSLQRDELIQALGLSLVTSFAVLAVALTRVSLLGASLFALAPAGVGVLFGQWLRPRN